MSARAVWVSSLAVGAMLALDFGCSVDRHGGDGSSGAHGGGAGTSGGNAGRGGSGGRVSQGGSGGAIASGGQSGEAGTPSTSGGAPAGGDSSGAGAAGEGTELGGSSGALGSGGAATPEGGHSSGGALVTGKGGATGAGGTQSGGSNTGGAGSGGAQSTCGNSAVEVGETCDDGNALSGDGCSTTCAVETGFACSGTPSACNRSCNGLAKTCGPAGDQDCCASNRVTGGTYNRTNDANYPATVSDFRLDVYEVTVGRFRKFVAAYSPSMIPAGAGKNPKDSTDPGWDTSFNTALPATQSALIAALKTEEPFSWTDIAGAHESLPINCVSWYEAQAFCIWDGGRLPTEAEWNYAAAGGAEQRKYPWGSATPDCSYANFYNNDYCVQPGTGNVSQVGALAPKGNAKFGQADMAGNVSEWNVDFFNALGSACNNCASFTPSAQRVLRDGAFGYRDTTLLTSFRNSYDPSSHNSSHGVRCARSR